MPARDTAIFPRQRSGERKTCAGAKNPRTATQGLLRWLTYIHTFVRFVSRPGGVSAWPSLCKRSGKKDMSAQPLAHCSKVLLVDGDLPTRDEAAVARFGCSQNAGLAVVILTGYPKLFVPEAFGHPAPALLTKPLDYRALLDVLESPDASGHDAPTPSSTRRSA